MNANGTMEVGIIGLGTMGLRYAEWLAELGHCPVGTDADSQARQRFETQLDASTFEDPQEMYDDGVDAVIITTPTKFHEPIGVQAFESGHDVLFEKPLAHTLESAERIAAKAAQAGQFGMVAYHLQFLNQYRVLESYIDRGFLGEITHIDAQHTTRRTVPSRGSWYTSQALAGGGALMDRGSFILDLLLRMIGFPATERVMAKTRTEFGNRQDYAYLEMFGEEDSDEMFNVEDSVTAMLEFETGCTASVEVAWASNTGIEDRHAYDIWGEEAGALLEIYETKASLSFFEVKKDVRDHMVESTLRIPDNNQQREQLQTFLTTVTEGTPPEQTTLSEAVEVNRLIDRLYTDAKKNGRNHS